MNAVSLALGSVLFTMLMLAGLINAVASNVDIDAEFLPVLTSTK